MARYMLDTNICIYLMKNQPGSVARRFAQCYVGDVIISAITLAELEYGALASTNKVKQKRHLKNLIKLIPVAPFGVDAALAYGPIRHQYRRLGGPDSLGNECVPQHQSW